MRNQNISNIPLFENNRLGLAASLLLSLGTLSASAGTPPTASVADVSVNENATSVDVIISLDQAVGATVFVDYAVASGTATAGSDFSDVSGTASFAPGELTVPVTIPILNDTLFEGDESFTLDLSNPGGIFIGDGSATVTIVDNEQLSFPGVRGSVAVFDDPLFVDTTPIPDSESLNLQTALADLGYTVETFTGTSEADWSSAFASTDAVVIPQLEGLDLISNLPLATQNSIKTAVNNGKGLVLFGDGQSRTTAIALMNTLFSWSLVKETVHFSGPSLPLDHSEVENTDFTLCPATLPTLDAVATLNRANLPAGSIPIYSLAADPDEVAAFAKDTVVYLGWDWYTSASQDPNKRWDQALDVALMSIGARNPRSSLVPTEEFPFDQPFDLDGKSITFKPDGNGGYAYRTVPITILPTDPNLGLVLNDISNSSNSSEQVLLTQGHFSFYGSDYDEFHVNGHGTINFGEAFSQSLSGLPSHLSRPQIAMCWANLYPGDSTDAKIRFHETTDRAVITFDSVPAGFLTSNTFQAELFFDGRIRLSYLGMDLNGAIVGLSDGTSRYETNSAYQVIFDEEDFSAGVFSPQKLRPQLAIPDIAIDENGGTAEVTATLSYPVGWDVAVDFATRDGSAKVGLDYSARSGTLTLPPGATTSSIAIGLIDDVLYEPTESFFMEMSSSAGAMTTAPAWDLSVAIIDNETSFPTPVLRAAPRVRSANGWLFIAPDDASGLSITEFRVVSLTGGVLTNPSNGSPISAGDTISVALGASGILTSNPGIVLVVEAVDPGTGLGLGQTGVDLDGVNATLAVVQFDASTLEIEEGQMAIALVQSTLPGPGIGLRYEIIPGTASPFDGTQGDYLATNGSLRIENGDAVARIPIFNDGLAESEEEFFVRLYDVSENAILGPRSLLRVRIKPGTGALVDPLEQVAPPSPASDTILVVAASGLTLSERANGWRFVGEPRWREFTDFNNDFTRAGLYLLEYQPKPTYAVLPIFYDAFNSTNLRSDMVFFGGATSQPPNYLRDLDDITFFNDTTDTDLPALGSLQVNLSAGSLVNQVILEAESGLIDAPFSVNAGTVGQDVQTTDPALGGRLRLDFDIPVAGDYLISGIVDAADAGSNSFFVNIDAEPTSPLMIWDIDPFTSGLEGRTVSWRGTGTAEAPEFGPKVFTLSSGSHTLYVRGRETGSRLDRVIISPASATPNFAAPPQWRMVGESASDWRAYGDIIPLAPGKHLVEFRNSVPGYHAPTPRSVTIEESQQGSLSITYAEAPSGAAAPTALASSSGDPYRFTGQFETSGGYSTGVVVANYAVLTAAAPLFDSSTLAYDPEVYWRYRPGPDAGVAAVALPSGVFLTSDYAAASMDDEIAVVYFRENLSLSYENSPGLGGFSGFLADLNAQPGFNPWIPGTSQKFLASYPMHDPESSDRGTMHDTNLTAATFSHHDAQLYTATGIAAPPGSEGAPLYVTHSNGTTYPAAICLGGTATGARFRAIDSLAALAIYRANTLQGADNRGYCDNCDAVDEYQENPSDQTGGGMLGYINALAVPPDATWTLSMNVPGGIGSGLNFREGDPLPGGIIIPVEVGSDYFITANDAPGYQPLVNAPTLQPIEITQNSIYTINVTYVPLAAGDYDSWAGSVFDPLLLEEAPITGPTVAAPWIGTTNFGAYAFGFDPNGTATPFSEPDGSPPTPGWPRITIDTNTDPPTVDARLLMRKNASDISYILEFADSPAGPWTSSGVAPTSTNIPGTEEWVIGGWSDVEFPPGTSSTRFCRVAAVHEP